MAEEVMVHGDTVGMADMVEEIIIGVTVDMVDMVMADTVGTVGMVMADTVAGTIIGDTVDMVTIMDILDTNMADTIQED